MVGSVLDPEIANVRFASANDCEIDLGEVVHDLEVCGLEIVDGCTSGIDEEAVAGARGDDCTSCSETTEDSLTDPLSSTPLTSVSAIASC